MHKMQSGTGRKTYNNSENTSNYASQKNRNYQSNKYTMIVWCRRKIPKSFCSNFKYDISNDKGLQNLQSPNQNP